MANVLADPALWSDFGGTPPSSTWTGTAYEQSLAGPSWQIAYAAVSPPETGDTVAGTAFFNATGEVVTAYLVLYSGTLGEWIGAQEVAVGGTTPFSFTFGTPSNDLLLFFADSPTAFGPSAYEGLELIVTPTSTPPPVIETCREIGRETRAYVSAHNRARVHSSRLYPNERRCLIADFNGAIPAGRTIVTARWDMDVAYSVAMADAQITPNGRASQVTITASYRGPAYLRCQVTLDNGEVYNQLFQVEVLDGPWFGTEQSVPGPTSLVANA